MMRETALTWSWINMLTKKRYDALVDVYGDLDAALGHVNEELLKSLGCREDTILRTLNRLEEFDVSSYEQELKKRELEFLDIEDPAYPEALSTLPDPPIFLYYKGSLEILDQPCIACVGTREMSSYGKRVVEEFIPAFLRAGLVTVSGLALGIDAHVASETVMAGGKTVAVLGHGLAEIYPKSNSALAERIVNKGGLLLSEFPLDQTPDKYTFPSRNRIIAGLSLGTIIFEAGEGSGALITADLALDYGRDVFAVPGQIFDEHFVGCHQIISKGHAKLVSGPSEVLIELGVVASEKSESSFVPKSELEDALFKTLTTMPQSVSVLVDRSRLDAGKVNTTLTMLELSGAAKNVGNGMWVRS